ncbi:hypothetical protein J2Z32_001848 [Paenibacillus turicensis]|uniref:FeoB-associated Cys-rich membrane protein n=1 Tax=Paenibacillus turicensis TaxID=160487 RepID=A0ABS4FRM4_9BACL|nr:hypothetical protein [Paenibacillus turicensis]
MADFIIIFIIATIMGLTLYRYIKQKKAGQSGCAGCSFSNACESSPSSCPQSTSTCHDKTVPPVTKLK